MLIAENWTQSTLTQWGQKCQMFTEVIVKAEDCINKPRLSDIQVGFVLYPAHCSISPPGFYLNQGLGTSPKYQSYNCTIYKLEQIGKIPKLGSRPGPGSFISRGRTNNLSESLETDLRAEFVNFWRLSKW